MGSVLVERPNELTMRRWLGKLCYKYLLCKSPLLNGLQKLRSLVFTFQAGAGLLQPGR